MLFDSLEGRLVYEGHPWTDTWNSRRTGLTLGRKVVQPHMADTQLVSQVPGIIAQGGGQAHHAQALLSVGGN